MKGVPVKLMAVAEKRWRRLDTPILLLLQMLVTPTAFTAATPAEAAVGRWSAGAPKPSRRGL